MEQLFEREDKLFICLLEKILFDDF